MNGVQQVGHDTYPELRTVDPYISFIDRYLLFIHLLAGVVSLTHVNRSVPVCTDS